MNTLHSNARRIALAFGVSSFAAVGLGCLVARVAGAPAGLWARNAAAWAIGAALAQLIARCPATTLCRTLMVMSPIVLLISLFSSGQAGVHRWIAMGPLNWNVAFVFLPAAAVAFAATEWRWTWVAALAVQAELWLQPDASHATAFAAAVSVTRLAARSSRYLNVTASVLLMTCAVLTWMRPDPLLPVPEVEGILQLAWAQSPGVAVLCGGALAAGALSPLAARTSASLPAIALCVYLLICSAMPFFGAFPVPLSGMGMSPIVGFWLGAGTLMSAIGNPGTVSNSRTIEEER